jgi:hypothetical protein
MDCRECSPHASCFDIKRQTKVANPSIYSGLRLSTYWQDLVLKLVYYYRTKVQQT